VIENSQREYKDIHNIVKIVEQLYYYYYYSHDSTYSTASTNFLRGLTLYREDKVKKVKLSLYQAMKTQGL
jgi:hypothetical protein